jgi:hypothetical protein
MDVCKGIFTYEKKKGVGVGGTTAEKFIGQMIDKVADRSNEQALLRYTNRM